MAAGRSIQGYTYAIIAALLFGVSTPLAKYLLTGLDPWLLAGMLYLGSGAGLLLVSLVRGRLAFLNASLYQRRDIVLLAGSTVAGGIIAPVLLMFGLSRFGAAGASLLLNLEGVFTALLAWFVFRENVDRRIALGMAAILAGGIALSWNSQASATDGIGPLCIIGACLAWAVDNNLTKTIEAVDATAVAMIKGLVAGSTNTLLALGAGSPVPTLLPGVAALGVGFVGYGVSLLCFVLALRQVGAARTGAYFSLAPFAGAAVAIVAGG